MSEKMTVIDLPGQFGCGLMDYGDLPAEKMIADVRKMAADWRAKADAIEGAGDDDFRIRVVRGVHVQHPIRTLQEGRPRP